MHRLLVQLLALLILVSSLPVQAEIKEFSVDELVPSREQRQAALIAIRVMDKYHYKKDQKYEYNNYHYNKAWKHHQRSYSHKKYYQHSK